MRLWNANGTLTNQTYIENFQKQTFYSQYHGIKTMRHGNQYYTVTNIDETSMTFQNIRYNRA